MADRDALRWELEATFDAAEYPVESPLDFAPALPNGPSTRFEAGEVSMTALELTTTLGSGDFPYDARESLVEDVLASLDEYGYF